MAGKRVSLASLAASKVEAVPGAGRPDLIHVDPHTVAPTPLNPRRNFNETELAELGEDMRSGQLQPCVAVPRAAYLKLYPEHAEQLPDGCRHVMAAGERRWRAALQAGLDTLDVLIRHDLTESRIRFLAAVLSENVQRANFNPIEEANGLRAMLELHDGNQSAAAQAMGKSKAWFNQRIGLLRLTDEMVQLVLEGKLTAFRDMRRYAALPPGEQHAAWKTDQEQPPAPRAKPVLEAVPEPQTYTAVYTPAASQPPGQPVPQAAPSPVRQSGPADYHGVIIPDAANGTTAAQEAPPVSPPARPRLAAADETIPEPRRDEQADTRTAAPAPSAVAQEAGIARAPKPFPYDDPSTAVLLWHQKMRHEDFVAGMRMGLTVLRDQHPDDFKAVLGEVAGQ